MKKVMMILVILFCLMLVTIVNAKEKELTIGKSAIFMITKGNDFDGIIVNNKNIKLQIYKDGKIKKESWKEINRNEEATMIGAVSYVEGRNYIVGGNGTWTTTTYNGNFPIYDSQKNPIKKKLFNGFEIIWNENENIIEIIKDKIDIKVWPCGQVHQKVWNQIN